jgi:hypothetical protein
MAESLHTHTHQRTNDRLNGTKTVIKILEMASKPACGGLTLPVIDEMMMCGYSMMVLLC